MGGDMSSPIKARCPDFQREEESIQRDVFMSFGVPFSHLELVTPHDERIRYDEAAALFPDDPDWQVRKCNGFGLVVDEISPRDAAGYWLYRYMELFHGDFD
jgi:hypothetical protein